MTVAFKRSPAPVYELLPYGRNVLFYDGPSQLTGERIFGIATSQNGNRKIGRMVQLWIMPAISPIEAVKTGRDADVCGDCKLRGVDGKGRVCYVEWWRSVENIWQFRDRAVPMSPEVFGDLLVKRNLPVRVGAYGDPVAIPTAVWHPLVSRVENWTAYTHQWQTARALPYRLWCMASVDSVAEQARASGIGWRTFRVRPEGGDVLRGEIVCPHEKDQAILCASCSLCRGTMRRAKNIVVTVHGKGGQKYFPMIGVVR